MSMHVMKCWVMEVPRDSKKSGDEGNKYARSGGEVV